MSEEQKSAHEIYEEMKNYWALFQENHERFESRQVKAAGVRARKSINEIRKLASKYRTACLAESKQL